MIVRRLCRIGLATWIVLGLELQTPASCLAEPPSDAELAKHQTEAANAFRTRITPFLRSYCLECHGDRLTEAGVNFSPALRIKNVGESAFRKQWKMASAQVQSHHMPPEDAGKKPTDEERRMFTAWVGEIKFLSQKDPGPFVIRRLTKVEYGNTLHDLLGVDPSVARDLPDDVFGEGYLNSLSPLQTEQYLGIAQAVLDHVMAPPGQPPTEVQKRLFGDSPPAGSDPRATARKIARSLARRAYRRPPTEAELDVLISVYDLGRGNQLDDAGSLRLLLKAVLVSPQFLFITPAKVPDVGQTIVALDDHQLASRMSYLLWATVPDAELSALADEGSLHEPAVLRAQVKRLLADRRARALFDGFGAQWLGLDELHGKTFDLAKFPQMTREMRQAMYEEARMFFDSIVRENRRVVDFVDSDYTFLNGTLAKLYGLEQSVKGPEMRRVKLDDANRGGILGMPGILATTSFPNRTSAVKRGEWVLEQVLGEHVPPAPPNVPSLETQDKQAVANLTLRQRTELHRTNAVCANCHKLLDPIGFGLENFDAIGRWRDRDESGQAIDAAGELPGGKRFSTPKELKAILASRERDLAQNLTEKLLGYALCRPLEGYDEIVVDQILKAVAQDGYRMQSILIEIVASYPFTNRRVQD